MDQEMILCYKTYLIQILLHYFHLPPLSQNHEDLEKASGQNHPFVSVPKFKLCLSK